MGVKLLKMNKSSNDGCYMRHNSFWEEFSVI